MAIPDATGRSVRRSVIVIRTPPQVFFANTLDDGVNDVASKWIPGNDIAVSSRASVAPSTYGAPATSNGVSVPRPTDTADSKIPMPGYSPASVTLRIFGEL